MKYLVIYDIADERRLRCVARHLRAYGVRVQRSAFECELADGAAMRLFGELKNCAAAGDSIIGYRISAKSGIACPEGEHARRGRGRGKRQKNVFLSLRG